MSEPFRLPQAPADGRRSRDAGQRVEVLRTECESIARLAAPEDSVEKIAEKLGTLPASTVHRRIRLMRDDLAQAGDCFIPSDRDPRRTPVAGRIARLWAKYRL